MTTARGGLVLVGLAAWALTASAPAPALAQKSNPGAPGALLLSGGQRQHHGFREQAVHLARLLENAGLVEVAICEDAALLETPGLERYGLILLTADRRDRASHLTDAQQQAIFDFVRRGGGFVCIHGGDNTPNDLTEAQTAAWKELLGGIYSHVGTPDGRAIRGAYRVHVADPAHSITRGLSDFDLKDELYSNMQMLPKVKPLLTIDYNGTSWPVAWTSTFGKGRVFHTSLGHRGWKEGDEADPLRDPNVSKLIVQGVEWVLDGDGDTATGAD